MRMYSQAGSQLSCLQRCKQVVSCKLHVQTMCHRLAHMHAPAAWIHNDYACHSLLHGSAMNASMYDIACSTGGKNIPLILFGRAKGYPPLPAEQSLCNHCIRGTALPSSEPL